MVGNDKSEVLAIAIDKLYIQEITEYFAINNIKPRRSRADEIKAAIEEMSKTN